ncbi:MAG: 3-deoxy-D-manno-octulosonic acid transferase [Saprospiraceae bacterium]
MLLLYNIAVFIYYFAIRLAAPFNEKAELWISGRQGQFAKLEKAFAGNEKPVLWMHCASLGEFEQGRPVLEKLRTKYPNHFLLLTFFSPSGYTIRKNYKEVDLVTYLPLDTAKNAERFLQVVQPKLVLFVKYEFWFHFLTIISRKEIPTLLVSALFRKEQHFFKFWGGFFRKMLYSFDQIFVQNENSEKLLKGIGINNVICCGDTRVDRVLQITKEKKSFSEIENFIVSEKVLVCGSTWPEDEKIIANWYESAGANWQLIIAPHDIQEFRIKAVEQQFSGKTIRYSQLINNSPTNQKVLIIDNIGLLSQLYRYGYMAYVGGGFGNGIHNTLEPAAYGIPICFGPNHNKFVEAKELVDRGGAFVVGDLERIVTMLLQKENYESSCKAVKRYMHQNEGATEEVMKYLIKRLD